MSVVFARGPCCRTVEDRGGHMGLRCSSPGSNDDRSAARIRPGMYLDLRRVCSSGRLGFLLVVRGVGWWCCTSRRTSPRKPGRENEAEQGQISPTWGRDKEAEDQRAEAWLSGDHREQQELNRTPNKRPKPRTPMESPQARAAQGHLLKAMVQRAHPVVQDLQDMRRLGGVAPGTMLRRGSRLQ